MKDTVEGGPASRLMRWALKLAEYRFTVEHKPGALHKDADGISRLVAHISSSRQTYLHAIQTLNPNTAELESSRKARTKTTTPVRSKQMKELKGAIIRANPLSWRITFTQTPNPPKQ